MRKVPNLKSLNTDHSLDVGEISMDKSVWICTAHIYFIRIKGNNMQSVCVAFIEILIRQ